MHHSALYAFLVILPGSAALNSTNEFVGWQYEPTTRGTWSILWSCTATLILCVYTVLHLSVPYRTDTRWLVSRQIFFIAIGLFLPDVMVFSAWQQWRYAKCLTDKIVELKKNRKAQHQMIPKYLDNWSMTQSFFVNMGGVTMYKGAHERENRVCITADGIVQLINEMKDEALSVVSKDTISDHSKADIIGKSLMVLQASHTLILVIVRLVNRTSVSALELSTCGYILTAFINMIFWWHKPFNAQDPLVLDVRDSLLNQQEISHYDRTKHQEEPTLKERVCTTTRPEWASPDGVIGFVTVSDKHPQWSVSLMFFASSTVAGLHLILWNAHFPTPAERWMWRIASIVLAAINLFLAFMSLEGFWSLSALRRVRRKVETSRQLHILAVAFDCVMPMQNRHCPRWWQVARDGTGAVFYFVARMYIIGECYLSLRNLPADVYSVPPWTSIIPNFG